MKRAWFQRIRGGDVKPWFMGKNPCFITLWFSTFVICHLSCLTQPLSTSLMFCWVVGQLWLLVDGQLLPLGVGWQDCQSFAHIHTPPTTPCFPCLFCSPHAPVHCAHGVLSTSCSLTHHDFGSVGSSCTGFGQIWSHVGILFLSTSG